MNFRSLSLQRSGRMTLTIIAAGCLVIAGIVFPTAIAEAGSLVIPAWSFARGNARIHADPDEYADAGPVVGSGPQRPWGWTVEYDVDVPVTGKYTLQICYAAAEARPMELFFDGQNMGKCCHRVTLGTAAAGQPAEPTWSSSGAKWAGFCKQRLYTWQRRQLHDLSLAQGTHTLKFVRRGPLPHLVALRLDTPEEFPEGWEPPDYEVRDLDAVPAEHRAAFRSGEVSNAIKQLPIEEVTTTRAAGSLTIPAWTFDRGNARIYASPDQYADAGPLIGDGAKENGIAVVEYDINFPVDGQYTLSVSYAAAEARPVDVFLDEKKLGKCCLGVTFSSAAYENPVRFTGKSSGAVWRREGLRKEGKLLAMSITKGKHTLKFARRGPLPHLMFLLLDSSTTFPKDWRPPGRRMRHLDRVPPTQRTAFLPPTTVNMAALRLAIQDTMTTYGERYPDGRQYLKRLAEFEKKQRSLLVTGGRGRQIGYSTAGIWAGEEDKPESERTIEDALKSLRRQAMLAYPALQFDKLLFLKRAAYPYGTTYSDQFAKNMGGNLCVLSLPDGKVTTFVPELEGGLFDRFDLSFDARKVVFGYKKKDEAFHIYEIEIDPEAVKMVPGSLSQLTFGGSDEEAEALQCNVVNNGRRARGFDDMDPCYLPDGRIMFTSTRSMHNVFCAGSTVTTLYVMDADGGNMRCLSAGPINETSPAVLDDGRVIYTRWEYVDKGLGNGQSLWVVRPDGSGSDHVFKNNTVRPAGMSNARSIPGSRKIVTIGGSHHFTAVGPVVLVDTRRSRRGTGAMTCLTPELGYPCMYWATRKFGFFTDPYPLSEKFFLVSHQPGKTSKEQPKYGIYVLDAWGNRARLCSDPDFDCYQPIPLLPRRKPTEIAQLEAKRKVTSGLNPADVKPVGTLFVQDVYQGLTGVERGRIKYLRVMGVLPWPWNQSGIFKVGLNVDVHRKKVYGIAKVHEDGSAYFKVPAEENVFFQALDENFMALQHMATFINLMPGENRSCIGCHELRRNAPSMTGGRPQAMKHPVQTLTPQPGDTGPRMVHYPADVQPILDKHCVGCHGGEAPKGRLDLTGMPTGMWNKSYENLIGSGLIRFRDGRCGRAGFRAVPPMTHGSFPSKLSHQIRKAPCNETLTREEFIKIVTWIDANVPYYGTYRGKRNLQDKDHPEFRALPLVQK